MSIFANVLVLGSCAKAARQLDVSVSSISQTLSKRENEQQVKLLDRIMRSIGSSSTLAQILLAHTTAEIINKEKSS